MTLNETIAALEHLRATHGGDVDVTVWRYSGGMDDLFNATPAYDAETQTIVLESPSRHWSGAQR